MTKEKKGGLFALAGAICFALYLTRTVFNALLNIIRYGYSPSFGTVLGWLLISGIIVALIMKNNLIFIGAVGSELLYVTFYLLKNGNLYNLNSFVAYSAITAMAVLVFLGIDFVKKLWFVPGACAGTGYFIALVWNGAFRYLPSGVKAYFFYSFIVAGLIFAGMWLAGVVESKKSALEVEPAPHDPQPEVAPIPVVVSEEVSQPVYTEASAVPVVENDVAQQLKMCKELLDTGVLTQEEFDAKKKQLLGL